MAQNIEKFDSISDLYNKVLPALKTKKSEFKREKLNYDEIDIWNYCVKYKWANKSDLRMYEVIDDILNVSFEDFKIVESNGEKI